MWGCGRRKHPHIGLFISFRVGIFSNLLVVLSSRLEPAEWLPFSRVTGCPTQQEGGHCVALGAAPILDLGTW